MILRQIAVQGWRCFANPVELGPLDDRINIVHGPNGTGKSTLLEAMIRGLMDNHASRGAATDSLRTEGRSLTPQVTIELEHDGQRFRVAKRFLDAPRSELSRHEGGRWIPLAEGRAADEHLRAMLEGVLPTRGLTNEEHWGLAQVLWAPQGKLHLAELGDGLTGTIRASLGAQMTSAAADRLEQAVSKAYLAVYTEKGRMRAGAGAPEVVRLQQQLDEAKRRRDELQRENDDFDTLGRQIDDARRRHEDLLEQESQLSDELKQIADRAKQYNELATLRSRQQAESKAAQASYAQLNDQVDTIESAKKDVAERTGELARLEEELPGRAAAQQRCTEEETEAAAALAAVEQRAADVAKMLETADRAKQYRDLCRRRDEQQDLIHQATELHGEIERLTGERTSLAAPDTSQLRAIRTASARCERARAELRAAMIAVAVEPETDLEIDVAKGDPSGKRQLTPGETAEIIGPGSVEIRIPGLGVIRATGPSESIDTLRAENDAAEAQWKRLIEGLPTDDVEGLEQLHDQASSLEKQIAAAKAQLQGLLGKTTIDTLQTQLTETNTAVARLEAQSPDWTDSLPDGDALAAEAGQARATLDADRDAAQRRHRQCQQARLAADAELAQSNDRIEMNREQLARAQSRLDELGRRTDAAQLAAELDRRAIDARAARASLDKTEAALNELGDDPNQKVRGIEGRLKRTRTEAQQAREQHLQLAVKLDALVAKAPYSALGETEEEIARLEESIAEHETRNSATRLLYETLRDCRSEAVEAVREPVEQRATELLAQIAGDSLGVVRFSESFLPRHVVPSGLDEPRSLGRTSGGEQEQVHFAVRLALAEVVSADQRHLIVLDDVLTATDPARLERILNLLDQAADRYQILILTCDPDRYHHLPSARRFDLEALSQGEEEPQMDTDEHRL